MTGTFHRRGAAVLASALTGAVALLLAGCAGSSPDAPSRTTYRSVDRSGIAPIVRGPGAADIGLKWNWDLAPSIDYASQIGWGETFLEVEWCAVRGDNEPGQLAALDRRLARADRMGYRMMLKIRVGSCRGGAEIFDPAEGTSKQASSFPDDPDAYVEFVRGLVTHYAARGVRTWAIENEVDANNFWTGTRQEYVELVKLGAAAIKDADPTATILDAGISSTGYGVAIAGELLDAGQEEQALAFYHAYYMRRIDGDGARFEAVDSISQLRRVLDHGRGKRVRDMVAATWDAVNAGGVTAYQLHFYENPALLPRVLDIIEAHLSFRVPNQAWEEGSASPRATYTTKGQAAEVATLLGILFARHISPVVYLPLAYTPRPGKTEVFRGLTATGGQELPAGEVYRRFAAAANKSTAITELAVDGGAGVLFDLTDRSFAVVWPTSGAGLKIGQMSDGTSIVAAAEPAQAVGPGSTVAGAILIDLAGTTAKQAPKDLTALLGVAVSTSR